MKTTLKILSLIAGILLLASCEKEIEFKGDVVAPMIVVNSFISPDSLITAHLSKSKFFLSNKYGFDLVNNAEVSIYINQDFKEKLNFTENGMYKGTIRPTAGDTVRLLVQVPGKETVESTAIVQLPSTILSVDTTIIVKSTQEEFGGDKGQLRATYINADCAFKVRIKDNKDERNYYRLVVKKGNVYKYENESYFNESFTYFSLDGVEAQSGNVLNLFGDDDNTSDQHLISDDLFNGKEFIFKFKIEGIVYRKPAPDFEESEGFERSDYVTINLQAITREMYLFLKSKESADGVFEGIFTEPVQIFNNISNGIGIFGAYTNHTVTFEFD